MAVPESMTVFDISGRYTMVRLLAIVGDLWSSLVLLALYVANEGEETPSKSFGGRRPLY